MPIIVRLTTVDLPLLEHGSDYGELKGGRLELLLRNGTPCSIVLPISCLTVTGDLPVITPGVYRLRVGVNRYNLYPYNGVNVYYEATTEQLDHEVVTEYEWGPNILWVYRT